MIQVTHPSKESLRLAVDQFWECFPPFWHRVRAHIREVAVEQFDITVEQFHILRHIRQGQGSVSEIAQAKRISRAAISQAMEALVIKGLVTRSQSQVDRRHVRLDLTVEGNALLDAIFEDTSQWLMRALVPLSEAELRALIQAMESLQRVLPA
jgi:DNA-binding MarR family transcriptional regulator